MPDMTKDDLAAAGGIKTDAEVKPVRKRTPKPKDEPAKTDAAAAVTNPDNPEDGSTEHDKQPDETPDENGGETKKTLDELEAEDAAAKQAERDARQTLDELEQTTEADFPRVSMEAEAYEIPPVGEPFSLILPLDRVKMRTKGDQIMGLDDAGVEIGVFTIKNIRVFSGNGLFPYRRALDYAAKDHFYVKLGRSTSRLDEVLRSRFGEANLRNTRDVAVLSLIRDT